MNRNKFYIRLNIFYKFLGKIAETITLIHSYSAISISHEKSCILYEFCSSNTEIDYQKLHSTAHEPIGTSVQKSVMSIWRL